MEEIIIPIYSFCISTYKRPELLKEQLLLLSKQVFTNFEVIVSDNDPFGSAELIVSSINDNRFKYWKNDENIGMIKSFNKSIERSNAEYVVLVTDDDPIEVDFLSYFNKFIQDEKSVSIYCGIRRRNKKENEVELIRKEIFLEELLDPKKTKALLWSSCIIRKQDILKVGLIPDYGSPHLADHALLALVGCVSGGLIINKEFSSLTSHGTNFSKSNFDYYYKGCIGFYNTFLNLGFSDSDLNVVKKHLSWWFISVFFALKRYFKINNKFENQVELEKVAYQILQLYFMKHLRLKYSFKNLIFNIKFNLRLLK